MPGTPKKRMPAIRGIRFFIARNLFLPGLHRAALCGMHRCEPIVCHEKDEQKRQRCWN
jgi:hypothetical protein